MKANSSDARIAIEAPKLAITIEIAALLPRNRENRNLSSTRARPAVSAIAINEAAITAGLIESSPISRSEPTISAEIPVATSNVA